MQGDHVHAQLLESLAVQRNDRHISEDEVDVTLELSGPRTTGGITVLLQQPWKFHPYWKGIEAVVNESRTLSAVDEAFNAVSCGTISTGSSELSIIDSLPYVRPQDKLSSGDKLRIRRVTSRIIMTKNPEIVLCMWGQAKHSETTQTMSELRSLGVGRDFDEPKLSLHLGSGIERVNSFHPSFAKNYNPYDSCFRQLLLLNVAKACRIYEGTWSEEEWMDDLKKRCRDEARAGISISPYCYPSRQSLLTSLRPM